MSSFTPPTALSARSPSHRLRFDFLDGIRGFASLFVVFHHGLLEVTAQFTTGHAGFSKLMKLASTPLIAGRFGVDIFIVLSGFCLTLPLVRAKRDRLANAADFFRRRCMRILPPYYAALLLSALLISTVPGLSTKSGGHWDVVLPAFTTRVWVSHLLLYYNWSPLTAYRINHALWSVATEWQIYLMFPIFLLPIRRWFGAVWLLIAAFALGAALRLICPAAAEVARPWYLGLFAIGMVAAEIGISTESAATHHRDRTPWLIIAAGLIVVSSAIGLLRSHLKQLDWVTDAAVGGAAGCVIVWLTRLKTNPASETHRIIRILEAPASVWLGAISYSLYLVHPPIIAMSNVLARHLHLSLDLRLIFVLSIGSIASLLGGFGFYWAVERWFVPKPKSVEKSTATVEALNGPAFIPATPDFQIG